MTSEYMISVTAPPVSTLIPASEKSGVLFNQLSRDPRSWSVTDVAVWLQSKNVPYHVVEAFQKEGITGQLFIDLTKDDMTFIGVRTYGEKLELLKLIKQLKEEWRIEDRMGGGAVNGAGIEHAAGHMEDGKGAPLTDVPPSYSAT
jgi:hypothetical protein